ncbi:hypothetical protein MNB_SUP05-SYMBIONT-7-489 [hydrothermal vent metagenome]|uniref:Lipoprotein n=1 Tax=hydrothermal vent metagenome TaxID=652676 RepID=A0A1W1E5J3_9ZZZZ
MLKLTALLLFTLTLSSCFLTKVVTVPLRVGGAVISVIPVIGDPVDSALDSVADVVDDVPI